MTVNGVWWWGSSSVDLGSVEYPFTAITPKSILTQNDRAYKLSSLCQIDMFEIIYIRLEYSMTYNSKLFLSFVTISYYWLLTIISYL